MTAPLPTAPRFTIQLNAATAASYGATTCEIAVQCDFDLAAGGWFFSVYEHRNGDWFRGPTATPTPIPTADSQTLKDINSMGIVAWLQLHVLAPFNAVVKSFYASRVAAVSPVPAGWNVTPDNFVSKMNDGVSLTQWADKDGDGIPELYAK